MTIPNLMSFFRILLIPVFCVAFMSNQDNQYLQYIISGAVLILSGLTDLFDGFVARKLNQVSDLGKLLDPIADKLTLAAVMICVWIKLGDTYTFLTPVFVAMLAKEMIMLIGGFALMKMGKKMVRAQWWGKVATAAFYMLMTATVFVLARFPESEQRTKVVAILIITTGAIMLAALACYVVLGIKILKGKGPDDEEQIIHVDNIKRTAK